MRKTETAITPTITRRRVLGGIVASATGALLPSARATEVTSLPAKTDNEHDAFATAKSGDMVLPLVVKSPSGIVVLPIDLMNGKCSYAISFNGREVIRPSFLGLRLEGAPRFDSHFSLKKTRQTKGRSSWKPPYGERNNFPDNFNAIEIELLEEIPQAEV